jgi:hypothetical protein
LPLTLFVLPTGDTRFSRATFFITDALEGLLMVLVILLMRETRFSLGTSLTGPLEGLLLLLLWQMTGERRFLSCALTAVRVGLLAMLLTLLTGETPLSLVPLDGLLTTGTVFSTFLTLFEDSDRLFSSSSQFISVLGPFFLYCAFPLFTLSLSSTEILGVLHLRIFPFRYFSPLELKFLLASVDILTLSRGAMHRLDIDRRPFLISVMSILPNIVTSNIRGLSNVAV